MNTTNVAIASQPKNPLFDEPNLIQCFSKDVEARGLVGEKQNAVTVLLCAVSALLPRPLNLSVYGESSSGKNHLLGKVADFIPEERKKFTTGMTANALMHAGEYEFQH